MRTTLSAFAVDHPSDVTGDPPQTRRAVAVIVAAATLAALTVLPGLASAAAPACQGRPATVVGVGSADLTGTDGDDVIVTGGVSMVYAGPGDDLVCVTGTSATGVIVDAGAGDDRVVVDSADPHQVTAHLGAGDDVFRGGAERDTVIDQGFGADPVADTGREDIATGDGLDRVLLGSATTSATTGAPVRDVVDLGPGDDELTVPQVVATGFGATAGSGRDAFTGFTDPSGPWRMHGDLGYLDDRVEQFPLAGFEVYDLPMTDASFHGGDADETVLLHDPANYLIGGRGDDVLQLAGAWDQAVWVIGGRGRDRFVDHDLPAARMFADLTRERLRDDARTGDIVRLTHVEDLDLAIGAADSRLTLVGTAGRNRLIGSACLVRARGLAGRDRLEAHGVMAGCRVTARFRGGSGRDRLAGAQGANGGDDRLLGGPGGDRAQGWAGVDTCRAEVRRHCERR